ncbi:MAG TPA: hypothetical protein VJ453_08145 [Terriglobales bacterium]|jgi:hypothetical protein|nr:hypothetical protein [Terriglobales bacterium]
METKYSKVIQPVNFSIVLLMLVGYVLMGCMMAEQNRTIAAQGELIHKLFQDTVRLSVAQMNESKATHTHHQ